VIAWNQDTLALLALTLTAALWMLLHLALSLRAASSPGLPRWLRYLGWLPPLTLLAGYRAGAKARALLWCLVALAYLVLRLRV